MRVFPVIATLVLSSNTSVACVFLDHQELSPEDLRSIVETLDVKYHAIDSRSEVRNRKVLGRGEAANVRLDFLPHESREGFEVYYHLSCLKHFEDGWTCGGLEERRGISFSEPDDFIEVKDGFSASMARDVVDAVREELIATKDGRYTYIDWDQSVVSEAPLDIASIRMLSDGNVAIDVGIEPGCTRHEILLSKIQCGLDRCAWKIEKNEMEHFL